MKLGYTILYVADVTRSIDFYERAFGLQRRFVAPGGEYGELETGATALGFVSLAHMQSMLPESFAAAASGAPRSEIALVSDDVAAAQARARAAGATVVMPPTVKPWGQTVAYVRDGDGHLVELCTPLT